MAVREAHDTHAAVAADEALVPDLGLAEAVGRPALGQEMLFIRQGRFREKRGAGGLRDVVEIDLGRSSVTSWELIPKAKYALLYFCFG